MGKYRIRVATGDSLLAGSSNLVQLWLVGEHGEKDLGKILRPIRIREVQLEVEVSLYLGRLLLVKLRKHKSLVGFDWFCKWIAVQGPGTQGEAFFPCYRWVQRNEIICLPEGTARTVRDDPQNQFKKHREQELEERRKVYRLKDLALKGTLALTNSVRRLEDFNEVFPRGKTPLAERVRNSWKDDALFGYQFLNGANPMLLRRSTSLPSRLVLPPEMEDLKTQLEKELQTGSLFEADFSLLDGVKPNVIIFKQQYVAAPLVMLKLQPDGRLLPMVIQLQPPRNGCPPPVLFLPSDPPMAWLLAKTWVRSSDFQLHQLQSHLLRGHLIAELLIPHFRYTMEINVLARSNLVSKWGIFDLRATAGLTYRSFCPPDDLADRGLLDVKSSLYGQDALRLWGVISRYVEKMVSLFYKSDGAVKDDPELQAWCREITETGLQGAQDRGFPISLESRAQLCHFITMCIFTCTGQHASTHQGQLDWYSWIPNGPCTMQKPPPISKDVTEKDIVDSLPSLHQARTQKTFIKFLGRRQPVMVALGQHKESYFSDPGPQAVLKQFQEELAALDKEIEVRNAGLDLPYEYLRPSMVENRVTI
ncbi:hypothetical protein Celaphus_00000930 [Cervus elaphus hippelaphus]|uniref:Uncharacterized protein n=1 Tax=Cervus elaphus hippelaphus TaxID=46360 RepID=A0A212D8Z0_CEREH|nr:hypothetical protein Celaphus_00000930 [Cervus elaphus hippelaphus]